MLAGLALNLTDNGLEIVSRNTVSAQTWDGDFNNNAYWGGIDVNEEQLGNNDNSTHSTVEPLTPPPIEGFDTTGPDIPDIDIPDNDSGQAVNSGSGYSDADDDGGYDDGMGDNDQNNNGINDSTEDSDNNEYNDGLSDAQDGDENSTTDYQKFLLEGVELLSKIGFGRLNRNDLEHYDTAYWNPYEKELILKEGHTPSEAVNSMFDNPTKYSVDCAEFVQILNWYAKMNEMGESRFNDYINNLDEEMTLRPFESTGLENKEDYLRGSPNEQFTNYSLSISDFQDPIKREQSFDIDRILDQIPEGSRVTFKNLDADKGDAFQYENIIKLGDNKWGAHGFGEEHIFTLDEIKYQLAKYTNPDPSDEYIRNNIFIVEIQTFK